jgi:ketosteroid isomerase-like protein
MNEQQNTALIQKMYDDFGRGDIPAILAALADDVEWSLEGPAIVPYTGNRKGPAEVLGFFEGLVTTQTNMKLTIEHWVAQGDIVATVGRYSGTVTATGKSFDTAIAHFFTIKDGKVTRLVDFGDTAAFAEAYTATASASA